MGYADYDEARRRFAALARLGADRNAHPLVTLRAMRQAERVEWETRLSAIRYARQLGSTWGDIGRALGISRQAARQRYARHIPDDFAPGKVPVLSGGETVWV